MPTALELVENLRLGAGDYGAVDLLQGAIDPNVTSIAFSSGAGISPNATISIGLEAIFVRDKPSITSATVLRGFRGSPAASAASGAVIEVGYRIPTYEYFRSLNKSLQSISAAFGKTVWDDTQSFGTGVGHLEVPANVVRVFEVGIQNGSYDELIRLPFSVRSFPTSLVSSGRGVYLYGRRPTSGAAYIGYEIVWPQFTSLSQSLDPAFPTDALHLIELGARAWLADNQMFERSAFHAPHVDLRTGSAEMGEVRLTHNTYLQKFLQERSEMAAIYGNRKSHAWLRR